MKILTEHEYSFTTTEERKIVRDVKEKLCYIAFDYDTKLKLTGTSSDNDMTYVLPDGSQISLVKEPVESTTLLSRAT